MSIECVDRSAVWRDAKADDTSLPLLGRTQAYLQSLLKRQHPGSVLVQAWQEFYRIYNDLIRRFVIAHGIRGVDVDDCVQEVWSAVAARLADFRRPKSRPGLRAWLYVVVRSKATDLLRRRSRHRAASLESAMDAGREPGSRELDPADLHELQWEDALLQTILADLRTEVSETNYQILHMRLIEGRSVGEVAAALDLTRERVRYRQHRMLRKVRARVAVFFGR